MAISQWESKPTPHNRLMVPYINAVPDFEDYIKALKIESGGSWPEENPNAIDIALMLLV
jgi:hypothetical protein